MSRDRMDPRRGGPDDAVTELLREVYAPPTDPGYWTGLEAAIMARVGGDRGTWGTVVLGWLPAGVAAAAIALLMAGIALMQERALETRLAYEQTIKSAAPMSVQTVAPPAPMSEREAILQFVMSR